MEQPVRQRHFPSFSFFFFILTNENEIQRNVVIVINLIGLIVYVYQFCVTIQKHYLLKLRSGGLYSVKEK